MELRKNPEIDLERKRGMFLSIGLLISMLLVLTAFEWSFKKEKAIIVESEWKEEIIYDMEILPTMHKIPARPKPIIKSQTPIYVPVAIENSIFEIKIEEPEIFELPSDKIEIEELPIEIAADFTDFAEVMPEPLGGMSAFYTFLGKNMKYPTYERRANIQGKVFIQFIIDKEGNITEAKIVKGISNGCDQEALRVLNLAPKWKPGKQGNQPVNVRMVVPINFVLN
ncbi:MAG: energy transducer TonB [Reichenbachiella sp.]